MPTEITFDNLLAGYSENAARGGETVTIRYTDFISSEDGDELVAKLEGLPQTVLSKLPVAPPGVLPSSVDTLLVILRKDRTATVYLNEVQPRVLMRVKGTCKKGEMVTTNQILDISRLEFEGVAIPKDCGIAYVFSVGWRKGFFYDLAPLHDAHGRGRAYDLGSTLGSFLAYLMFQERFKIDEATWDVLLSQKWFPFAHLDNDLIREMISHARLSWRVDDLLPKIADNVKRLLSSSPLDTQPHPVFAEHRDVIRTAVARYMADDHVSAASILYPRIEGLLRSFLRAGGYTVRPTAKNLAKTAVEHNEADRVKHSLLLPSRFQQYLDESYFAQFVSGTTPDVGRHSVAHGEARQSDFSLKATTVAFLLVYQLSLFFSDGKKS